MNEVKSDNMNICSYICALVNFNYITFQKMREHNNNIMKYTCQISIIVQKKKKHF